MGNCASDKKDNDTEKIINKNMYSFLFVVGKGGFGKVWKVQQKKNKMFYAMKEMSKARILSKRSVNSVMNEKKLLTMLKHPFLVNMQAAFQDKKMLYLVMDMMVGGDLRYHIGKQKRFSEEQTKFFAACIVTGLEYIHINGIIHRDIKPENLVLDGKGYVRITDFGIARVYQPENKTETSGTPGYMAPEVMCRQNHGIAVDYFALGVIVYEFMTGRRPYHGRSRKEIREAMLSRQVQLKRHEIPEGWSLEAADFANKLIQRKPNNRLGFFGPQDVKSHAWLRDVNWQKIYEKSIEPPFRPIGDENFSESVNVNNDAWMAANSEAMRENSLLLRQNSVQALFAGYFFEKEWNKANATTTRDLFKSF